MPLLRPEPGRRRALRVLATAGIAPALASCAPAPPEKLLPYLIPPEDVVPGVATWYATTCRECPAGCGMLVRVREGRAVKAEGHPGHPLNRGALCVRGQAALQGLYDPDRVAGPYRRDRATSKLSWDDGIKALAANLHALREAGRADRIAFVTPLLTGSLDAFVDRWLLAVGGGTRVRYEPFAYEPLREASRRAFGKDAIPRFDFAAARMIVSFGADFLETWLQNVAAARSFREARSGARGPRAEFVHVEARRSLTASAADTWLSVEPGGELSLALAMARVILDEAPAAMKDAREREALRGMLQEHTPERAAARAGVGAETVRQLALRFAAAQPGLAVGGGVASSGADATETQVAIHLLNYVAGNVGRTVQFGPDSAYGRATPHKDVMALVERMRNGEIELLLVSDANPAFTLPAAAGFAEAAARVPNVVSFSSSLDETAQLAALGLPSHTPLEAWGDHEPVAGVRGLQQPVVTPVFDTRHLGDILLGVAKELGEPTAKALPYEDFLEYLRGEWGKLAGKAEFEGFWADALRKGGAFEERPALPVRFSAATGIAPAAPAAAADARTLALVAYPSLHLYDGRGANKPWLQEIPDALAKASWGSWAELHPETCRTLGLTSGQLVSLESPQGKIELPALPTDAVRPGVVAVPIGQGHTAFGRFAKDRGQSPLLLLPAAPEAASGGRVWAGTRVNATARPVRRPLVVTQTSFDQAGRGVAQAVRLADASHAEPHHEEPTMYPEHDHPDHRWGMAIDVDACIGCNACVAACYAENNVPVIGPDPIRPGREMAWLRIERYVESERGASDVRFVPMLCQHCDHAPCEAVCPVYATYHNDEGLNAQVYNRCVGTRYCANNCPYKVRRFSFFEYRLPSPLDRQYNPDVTVRSKGVMEKCTFCVQRIQGAKDRAKDQGRPVRDGDVVPACAGTCPTNAITFGDLKDAQSRVAIASRDPRGYRVFESLNTRPAITYLKKVLA